MIGLTRGVFDTLDPVVAAVMTAGCLSMLVLFSSRKAMGGRESDFDERSVQRLLRGSVGPREENGADVGVGVAGAGAGAASGPPPWIGQCLLPVSTVPIPPCFVTVLFGVV